MSEHVRRADRVSPRSRVIRAEPAVLTSPRQELDRETLHLTNPRRRRGAARRRRLPGCTLHVPRGVGAQPREPGSRAVVRSRRLRRSRHLVRRRHHLRRGQRRPLARRRAQRVVQPRRADGRRTAATRSAAASASAADVRTRGPFGGGLRCTGTFNTATGRLACAAETQNGLTIARSAQYKNAAGTVQQAFDSPTTNRVNVQSTRHWHRHLHAAPTARSWTEIGTPAAAYAGATDAGHGGLLLGDTATIVSATTTVNNTSDRTVTGLASAARSAR